MEGYDGQGPKGNPEGRWRAQEQILNFIRDFTKARGKKMAIPEWAIMNEKLASVPANFNTGGDNGYHIQKICEYAKNKDNNVAYHIYFNGSDTYPWHDLRRNPNAMAAYRNYCR